MNKILIVGLGYVGLPLAVEFSKKYDVVGYDINLTRINELKLGIDKTHEIEKAQLKSVLKKVRNSIGLSFTNEVSEIKNCNIFIITVPTPIDIHNRPLLDPLSKASKLVASLIKKNSIVIYESTVYPGVTEEFCVPILEKYSRLKFNKDFFVGYSPERINPGDKNHTVSKILKITSGSTKKSSQIIDSLYKSIITAGTFKASSIKVAEAAKVIENTQRDINIAFINELSMIFNLLKIDTSEVLKAASTKWNFLSFKPGLVGGHCIGVDPYYLAQKALEVGYHPEIILAGRRVNDGMGKFIANETIKLMIKKNIQINNSKVLILGITFKENCTDVRNTKVIDIYNELYDHNIKIDIYDPWADSSEVEREYKIKLIHKINSLSNYSAIILAVAHKQFNLLKIKKNKNQVVFDVKSFLPINNVDYRL
jgi:UDP-N-acetyl-D-galactosamine dehydrogenase